MVPTVNLKCSQHFKIDQKLVFFAEISFLNLTERGFEMKRGERVYGWVPLHSVDCQFAETAVTRKKGKPSN